MSGAWLASYIVLWAVVAFQGIVIFILLRQLGIMYLGTAQGVARDGLAVGSRAPEFSLPDVSGGLVSLADYRGKPLLLVFGSVNCAPCRALVPDLHRFAAERRDEWGVLFLCRGTEEEARGFASELAMQVPVASHPDESLAEKYKARVTPFAFVVDGEGAVKAKGLANNYQHLEMLERSSQEHEAHEQSARRNGAATVNLPAAEEEIR